MKAVLFHRHGGNEVLEYGEIPAPEPAAGEVLVRMEAAALNRVDLFTREGWPGLELEMPHVPGADGAGRVVEVGSQVAQFAIGDRVVINPNLTCGECDFCLAGQENLCNQWRLLGETDHPDLEPHGSARP
ncbi:MAG: alcohol dehydrogenase catalytic domain-containing protein [Anaerolineales bacterium]